MVHHLHIRPGPPLPSCQCVPTSINCVVGVIIFTVEEDGGEERERGGGEEELATNGAQASLGVQQRMVGIVDPVCSLIW